MAEPNADPARRLREVVEFRCGGRRVVVRSNSLRLVEALSDEFAHAWLVKTPHVLEDDCWTLSVESGAREIPPVGSGPEEAVEPPTTGAEPAGAEKALRVQLEHDLWAWKRAGESVVELWDDEAGWYVKLDRSLRIGSGRAAGAVSPRQIFLAGRDFAVTKRLAAKILVGIYRAEIFGGGGIALHASGVAWRGQGWVFCGQALSGKTTCMMDLLATGETAYLGNDLIYVDGRRAVMPPIWGPSVGCKTLLSLPRFSWLAEEKAGAAVGRYIRSNTGEMKLYIPLQNLVSHLGVPLASTVALRAVFFPSLDLDGDGVRTEPLEWSDARDALRSSANLVGDADHPDWMGLVPGNNDAEEIDRRIRDLFSGLTLARVVLGCRSRGKGDLLRALLCVSHE